MSALVFVLAVLAMVFLAAIALIFVAIILRLGAGETRQECNIQPGEISYSDLDRPAGALFSRRHLIAGKPDYIVRNSDGMIPVEVKGCCADAPYGNHALQVAAYCLLVAENFGREPDYGVLVYRDRQFRIGYDYALKMELQNAVGEMRRCLSEGRVERNCEEKQKCTGCGFRRDCKEGLYNENVL